MRLCLQIELTMTIPDAAALETLVGSFSSQAGGADSLLVRPAPLARRGDVFWPRRARSHPRPPPPPNPLKTH